MKCVQQKRDIKIDKVLADQFEKYMRNYPMLYGYLADIIVKYIPKSSKKPIVVDIGTGPGLLLVELHKLSSQIKTIGLDLSINMLTIAKNNLIKIVKEPHLLLAKAENIPLNNASVDVVVSRFSLSSWDEPGQCFAEIFRVLKPNGKLVLEVLNKDFPRWKLLLIKFHMRVKGAEKRVIRYHIDYYKNAYSISKVEQILIKTGFKIIKKEGSKKEWKFLIISEKH